MLKSSSIYLIVFTCLISGVLYSSDSPQSDTSVLEQKLNEDPKNSDLRVHVATSYMHKQQYEKAENHFKTVLKDHPDYFDAAQGYANSLAFRKRYDEAINFIKPYLGGPNSEKVNKLIEKFYLWDGNYIKSREYSCKNARNKRGLFGCRSDLPTLLSVELDYGYTDVTNTDNWHFDSQRVKFSPYKIVSLELYRKGYRRYDKFENLIGTVVTLKPFEFLTVSGEYYYTPAVDFLAKYKASLTLYITPISSLGLVLYGGYSYYDYSNSSVTVYTPGVEYYLPFKTHIGGTYFYIVNGNNQSTDAYMIYGGYTHSKNKKIMIGYSSGSEFIESKSEPDFNNTISIKSLFIRGRHEIYCPFSLKGGISYTSLSSKNDSNDSKRTEFKLGIVYDF